MIVTRFAPSPTGFLHAGNYRTAIFAYLVSKKNNGKFILRIEDTDKARSKKEYEDNIIESLNWLGLGYNSISRQSDRTDIYKSYIEKLIKEDKAYISDETEGERKQVIRFRNPNKKVTFKDLIRGDITFDTEELGDFVIARSIDEPVFHLVVCIDDHEAGVTHIIRGEDHISNTPRHILIQEAIGAKTPEYAHLPLLLSSDRSKLSKRKGALAITEYRNKGYLKQALLNYLCLLGWNPGTDQEIFSIEELIQAFDLNKVQKSGAIFDEEKLKWFNKKYIEKLSLDDFITLAKPFFDFVNTDKKIIEIIKSRIHTLAEIENEIKEFDFIKEVNKYENESLFWKDDEKDFSILKNKFEKLISILETVEENSWKADKIKEAVWPYALEVGKGSLLWPYRYCLTGKEKSPDPFLTSELLGKEQTISRIKNAISML